MRTVSGLLLGAAAAVGFVALAPARAAAPVIIEKSLLGVRILQTYHEVLAKLGQPKMICRFGEFILVEDEKNAQGQDTGAVKSISYEGGNGGAGGGGAPGSGGGGMAPAAPGAAPGVPGGGMKGGGPGSGGGPGGGSSGSDPDTTFGETGGYAWIYTYPNHTAYIFFFNLEGRVFAIQETGITAGMPTQRGLRLGDPVKKLYETYGWPDTIQDQDVGFILDYSSKYHAKIAVVLGKVAGIGVELEENMKFTFFPPVNSNGGGGGPGGFGGAKGRAGGGGGGGSSAAGPQAAPPGL